MSERASAGTKKLNGRDKRFISVAAVPALLSVATKWRIWCGRWHQSLQ